MLQLEEFHELIARLFDKHKVPALANAFKIEAFHTWSDQLSTFFKKDKDAISQTCSEAYWSVAEIQLAIGHCLWIFEQQRLTSGCDRAKGKIEHIQIGLHDIYYWYHVGCAWEMIYRAWERVALLLRLLVLDDGEKRYYDGVINEIGSKLPWLKQLQNFQRLRKHLKRWGAVAHRRNSLTHKTSSVFSLLEIQYKYSGIFGPDGKPIFVDVTTFPDPERELQKILSHYVNTGKLLIDVYKFLADFQKNEGTLREEWERAQKT